jgi:hypothetical protein
MRPRSEPNTAASTGTEYFKATVPGCDELWPWTTLKTVWANVGYPPGETPQARCATLDQAPGIGRHRRPPGLLHPRQSNRVR